MSHDRDRAGAAPRAAHGAAGGSGVGLALLGLLAVSVAGLAWLATDLLSTATADGPDATATLGASTDGYDVWARNEDGSPVRWDPCAPIHLVIADDGAPAGWRDDLDRAMDEVGEVSGLAFEVEATTDERPDVRRPAYQPDRYGHRWAPVLVAWSPPGEGDLPLHATDRGLAIPLAVGVDGDRTYVTGQIVLNRERDDLEVGFADRAGSWGATLLHELGHLLGLAHADDHAQLMAHYPGEGPVVLGEGDRAGLRAVGSDAGCRAVPDPGPIEIPEPHSELDILREERRGD